MGGEFLWSRSGTTNCFECMGVITARGGPVPANITSIFPDPFNVDTWNLAALTPITQQYELGIGTFDFPDTMPMTSRTQCRSTACGCRTTGR
jgi:hypothetical protein